MAPLQVCLGIRKAKLPILKLALVQLPTTQLDLRDRKTLCRLCQPTLRDVKSPDFKVICMDTLTFMQAEHKSRTQL